ncbi:MAG: associated Golgi protein-related protein [Acidobacteria bacterium]|nr:associated Golgi protein-related protein [Acidobacteriota bacterium]
MKRWWSLAAAISLSSLLLFLAFSAAGISILEDPSPMRRHAGPVAALIGVGLLVADIVLPVPSSLVMIVHGALFGVFWGAVLSVTGSVLSALAGFAIGRAGTPAIRRFVTEPQHERASAFLERWGVFAIALSRPIPILAETVSILAGSSSLRWHQAVIAATAGSLVPAAAYAWAGAHASTTENHVLIFGGVLLLSALLWGFGRGKR